MRDFYGRAAETKPAQTAGNDTALIVALMLLLKGEQCDPMLIFALMYILT